MNMKLPLKARFQIAVNEFLGRSKSVGGFQLGQVGTSSSYGGGYGSQAQMLRAYSNLPWLRAAFGKVADGVAASQWYLEAATKNEKVVKISSWATASRDARVKIKKRIKSQGGKASVQVHEIYDHILIDTLSSPNPMMQGPSLLSLTQLYIDLVGEALWWVRYQDIGGKSVPYEFWPVPPSWIRERPKSMNDTFKLQPDINEGFPEEIPMSDMIWFRKPDPADPYQKTTGTAEPLKDELEADEYAAQHIKSWFLNRARPDLIITGTGLGPEEAARAEERWLAKFRGFWKAHRPHFIGQEAKVHEISGKFTDMQLIDLRKWQRDVVLQSVGLPPEILGVLESSNRATIDTAAFIFAKWVLTPRLEVIRSTLQTQLIPMYDDRIVLEFNSPVEEDREFALSVRKAFPWAYSIDELREVTGDAPVVDGQGDMHAIPATMVLVKSSELDQYESPYTARNKTDIESDMSKANEELANLGIAV